MKFLPLAALCLSLTSVYAADPQTLLAEKGKLVFSDDLSALDKKEWNVAKGKWEVVDGALKGAELAADKHGGVLRHVQALNDAIIQYDVKLDGGKMTTLSINAEKGHLCRVLVSPAGFAAQKDDSDHDGPDKAVPFGRRAMEFKPGAWHTVTVEVVVDTLVATVDGKDPIAGSHEALTTKKGNFGFTISGETVSVRNVRVWEATPKASASEVKAKLISETPKPAPVNTAARKKAAK